MKFQILQILTILLMSRLFYYKMVYSKAMLLFFRRTPTNVSHNLNIHLAIVVEIFPDSPMVIIIIIFTCPRLSNI